MRDYSFGNYIASLRVRNGLSQFQLGRLVGVTDKAVSKWENGSSKPRLSVCNRLAEVLEVSLDVLLSCGERENGSHSSTELPDLLRISIPDETPRRMDTADQKRIELHLRTGMSAPEAVGSEMDYLERAAQWGHSAMAVTDVCSTQSWPMAVRTANKLGIKPILGCEAFMIPSESDWEHGSPVMLLAADRKGIIHMNQLMTASLTMYNHGKPCMPKALIQDHRDGLLIGSACNGGEIIQALQNGELWETLKAMTAFYDYLEIQPPENYIPHRSDEYAQILSKTRQWICNTIRLGDETGIPVCAVGNVSYLDPEDQVALSILHYKEGRLDQAQSSQFFHTTEEMLNEFIFLGEEAAHRVVIDAPGAIASRVHEHISLYPEGKKCFYPVQSEDEDSLLTHVRHQAACLYGDPLPPAVAERLDRELNIIVDKQYTALYSVIARIVQQAQAEGYPMGIRGMGSSSLASFLSGITEINPLPPHYRCPECRHTIFVKRSSKYKTGADLPEKQCPRCGQQMIRDGFDIPYEMFLGLDGNKVPDFDLNIAPENRQEAIQLIQKLFGKVYVANTIQSSWFPPTSGVVNQYAESQDIEFGQDTIDHLSEVLGSCKMTDHIHSGGIIPVPDGYDINDFCPVQPAIPQEEANDLLSTHYDFSSMWDVLLKLDLLPHNTPYILHLLQEKTGIFLDSVPVNDPKVLAMFSSVLPLGVTEEAIQRKQGTLAIPEFGTDFVCKMLQQLKPHTVEELIRINALSHGTGIWGGNVQEVVKAGIATITECPANRDEIMNDLIVRGMDTPQAFRITESIRRGRGLTPEMEKAMRACHVPEWYMDICKKIKYLFPRAHSTGYTLSAIRIAWYKLYYPREFFQVINHLHNDALSNEDLSLNLQQLRRLIFESKAKKQAVVNNDQYSKLLMQDQSISEHPFRQMMLELLLEMKARGVDVSIA